MPYRKGTLVTHYTIVDETEGFGELACDGYRVDNRDEFGPLDVCIGIVRDVEPRGILVEWIHFCKDHKQYVTVQAWFESDELYELGQLA